MKLSDVLSSPERWTKHTFARDAAGKVCDIKGAACWCLVGAVILMSETFDKRCALLDELDDLAAARGYASAACFNDAKATTFADIQAIIAEVES